MVQLDVELNNKQILETYCCYPVLKKQREAQAPLFSIILINPGFLKATVGTEHDLATSGRNHKLNNTVCSF